MTEKKIIYCFGDSWGVGDELTQSEKPFCHLLADNLAYDLKNFSMSGMSLGMIVRKLSQTAHLIEKKDTVLVVIPPDSRWYTEWQTMNYNRSDFFIDKTDDWFSYHHQLFIFSICEILNKIGCSYVLMHNYGEFPMKNSEYYFSKFYHEKFLSLQSLTSILTSKEDSGVSPIVVEILQKDHKDQLFFGPYFKGNICHPNQEGHIVIANLIEKKLQL